MTASAAGVWMFYVQHQFEDAYWERREEWDYTTAALQGSSFYKLPRILQWLSGNIGFQHIHHLSPRIANYNLEGCHNSHPMFQDIKPLTLFDSLKSLNFRLWDEQRGRLVGFRRLRESVGKRNTPRKTPCTPMDGREAGNNAWLREAARQSRGAGFHAQRGRASFRAFPNYGVACAGATSGRARVFDQIDNRFVPRLLSREPMLCSGRCQRHAPEEFDNLN